MDKASDANRLDLQLPKPGDSHSTLSETLATEGYWAGSYASKAAVNTLGGALGELMSPRTPNWIPDFQTAKPVLMEGAIAFGLVTGGEGFIDSMFFPDQKESFATQLVDTVSAPLILGFAPGSTMMKAGVVLGLHLLSKLIDASTTSST
jgi:hypothetical protein